MRFAGNKIFLLLASVLVGANASGAVKLGIDVPESSGYAILAPRGVSAGSFTAYMNSQHLGGMSFSEYRRGAVWGGSLHIDPAAAGNLTAVNIYALAEMNRQLRTNLITRSSRAKREMFFKCCRSSSIASQFAGRMGPARIFASWTEDVSRFKGERNQYLLY